MAKEEDVLRSYTHDLTILIAGDLTTVATKLFQVGLISQAQFQQVRGTTKQDGANDLVLQVISQVKTNRKKFGVFLNIFHEIPTLKEKAGEILKVYNTKVSYYFS